MTMRTRKRVRRSTARLGTLDDFLESEGKREEFEATAVKEVLAWRIARAMRRATSRARDWHRE
jgi:antitoxin HicB